MRTQTVTFNVPVVSFGWTSKISSGAKDIGFFITRTSINTLKVFNSFIATLKERRSKRTNLEEQSVPRLGGKEKLSLKKFGKPVKFTIAAVIVVLIVTFAGKAVVKAVKNSKTTSTTDIRPALATLGLNKELSFPLNDDNGKKVADIKYLIESAELRDEILVQGQRATAVKGRLFLILTVKITNDYKSSIQINSKDYVRLSVNGNEDEWLAPDIHNDPVEVQAISTKYTRLGFAINTSDKDLVLSVGEVNGDKEKVPLDFKK